MTPTSASATGTPGRRERNKQLKLERITAAADDLFARFGVDEVTTQQIADAADIGTGTLFLYAKTKAELLLMVQNAHYAEAIAAGVGAATSAPTVLDAVMAIVQPVVDCNRRQVDNGRTYLRELVFGDPTEPHRQRGLALIQQADDAVVEILHDMGGLDRHDAVQLARTISATMFISLASPLHLGSTVEQIGDDIREQVRVVLHRSLESGRSPA